MKMPVTRRSGTDSHDDDTSSLNEPSPTPEEEPDKTLRYTSLLCLTLQNALLILTMRYVRIRGGDMFVASTAVIMAEFLKTIASLLIILFQEGSVLKFLKHLGDNMLFQPLDCIKVSVPALIYTLQNNLLYLAVSNLDAATYQVTYQLKILTTAIFSVIMLGKSLSRLQWISLVVLFIGVSIVQLNSEVSNTTHVSVEQKPMIGFLAVVVSSLMSGFAGVYFEKILKGTQQSVWLRNVQLGILGVVIGYITMEIKEGDKVRKQGFLFGYDSVVWTVVILQSYGGLMVAVVVKYADNILKGFAASASIIISCIASIMFFEFHLSLHFVIGVMFVVLSIYMYARFAPITKVLPFVKQSSI
ncbi:hypothetical protein ACJMK2_016935 [Sinanodonta woodiana]|uniref:UDP-N-acetylglucosamine transporter n=1 Tax=Sinanodonta woodiana TaxID=1069815 RepID=A0ABD3UW16_SINWO